jgi:hypothetical protein
MEVIFEKELRKLLKEHPNAIQNMICDKVKVREFIVGNKKIFVKIGKQK